MTDKKRSKFGTRLTVFVTLAMLGGMIVAVSYSPTLYQLFCAVTGYNGTTRRATAKNLDEAGTGDPIRVHFDANVANGLDWEFRPEQRDVSTTFGKPTKVYYYAKNNSDHTIVARAVFNVTPFSAAPYFFKIECFCFTEEKLAPGESAEMPLVFYVDEQMRKDVTAGRYDDLTLSYTFYEQKDLSDEDVAKARELSKASEEKDAELSGKGKAQFDNDALRK